MSEPILVTGASGGIGSAIVRKLAQGGAERIVAIGTRVDALDCLERDTGCETIKVDLCDPVAVQDRLANRSFSAVVHGAGILGPQAKIFETPPDVAASLVSLNILGTVNLLRAIVPRMRLNRSGTIIFLGSICGNVPGAGPGIYSACKAALQSIAANLRFDLRGEPIRVSEIRLGRVKTGIHEQLQLNADLYKGYDCVEPEDVAGTVVHVLSAPPAVDLSVVEMMPTLQIVGGTFFQKNED